MPVQMRPEGGEEQLSREIKEKKSELIDYLTGLTE